MPKSLDGATLVTILASEVPELPTVISEHKSDNDGLLLHLLLADVLKFAASAFEEDPKVVQRILGLIDLAFRTGDEHVQNAVAVSFVEHVGAFPNETRAFIATWPEALATERRRQINYRA